MGFLSLCLLSLSRGAPQYSGDQTGALDAGSLDTIAEIFGSSGKQVDAGYGSGQQTGALSDDVDVLVQVIQESNNEYPNDYVPESAQQVVDKATVEVNTDFENCADYTESLGYECVPYYQCHNGTIITDGAGLIDIRIFDAQIQGFQQCTVQWDNPAAPLVDVSDFGRTQNTYTEDSSDLVAAKETNTYSQDTSANILEAKAPEPVY